MLSSWHTEILPKTSQELRLTLDLMRTTASLVMLSIAAITDWRNRRASDRLWIALGSLGIVLLAFEIAISGSLAEALTLVTISTLFFGIFFGKEMFQPDGIHFQPVRFASYLIAFSLLAYLIWHFEFARVEDASRFNHLLAVIAMYGLMHILYYAGVVRGGADAKAVMALATLFPAYPYLDGLPMFSVGEANRAAIEILYPFSLVVLTDAALLFVFVPLVFLVLNSAKGNVRFPLALFAVKVPIALIKPYYWVLQKVEDGMLKTSVVPWRDIDMEEQLQALRAFGVKEVWATPQFPFLVAILAGFIIAMIWGNLLLNFLLWILGTPL